MSAHAFFSIIREMRPELSRSTYNVISHGKQGNVLEVDDEFFKMPGPDYPAEDFRREIDTLQMIKGMFFFRTPEIRTLDVKGRFFSTHRIPGIRLTQAISAGMPYGDLLSDIAAAMKEISAFLGTAHAASLGMKKMPQISSLDALRFARRQASDAGMLEPGLHSRALSVEEELSSMGAWPYATQASHGDMSFDNIIVSPHSGRLAGILDFGRVGFHPEELDFTRFTVLGPVALTSLLRRFEDFTSLRISIRRVVLLRKARMLSGITRHLALCGMTPGVAEEIRQLDNLFQKEWNVHDEWAT